MMREIPVRDTDPDPFTQTMNSQEEDRSSPIAFTVDFGKTKGSCEEKSRKLERFVQKSSQRRVQSPLPGGGYKLSPAHRDREAMRRKTSRERKSFSLERRKDREEENDCGDYDDEKFEVESDKSASETGTYTVDKEDEVQTSLQEPRLSSLASNKTSYVEEWATKHAFSVSSPPESFANSPNGTKSSLSSNKSRRLLPATPHLEHRTGAVAEESLQYSPDSEQSYSLTPPHRQEESEDESSYVSHTQHLVEVMEERIKQKNLKKLEIKSTRSLVSGNSAGKKESKSVAGKKPSKSSGKNSVKSPEPHQEAMEAWKRRKNYNPMIAAGRKRLSDTRKVSVGQEETTSESESQVRPSRQARSAPASGKTRGGQTTSTTSTTPLRRLAHTNSSSSLQGKSNRSSSSLTSKELEFQAWKRRKDYDPRKSAARPSSSRKVSAGSSQSGGGGGGGQSSQARHSKLSMLSSSAMTKSLVIEELSSDAPMQRSNSFHLNGKKNVRHNSEEESESEGGSGYSSSLAESQMRSYPNYPHYYLDDDELILPIQSSHSNMSQRSLYNSRSPQVSPNKSRTKLEALDSLVISTIHNVSNKLCSSSAAVLRQAALVLPNQEEDRAATLETLETVIYLLEDLDLPPSPAKKTSRELSGTLRNLKKIEQSMEMMKKLLEPEADEEEEDDE